MGVEPTPSAWEADVLPIYYICVLLYLVSQKSLKMQVEKEKKLYFGKSLKNVKII